MHGRYACVKITWDKIAAMSPLAHDDHREIRRLAKLQRFAILDTPREQEFDSIVLLAQRLLGAPIALVSLVDDHRQWFKARCGLDVAETGRGDAFCAHAIHVDDIMVVEDATQDARFADNPLVTGAPHIRFYAGVPLRPQAEGYAADLAGIGTLCVIDTVPRTLSTGDAAVLRHLAGLVSALIAARATAATAMRLSQEACRDADRLEMQYRQLRQAERMAGIGSWRLDLADRTINWSDQVFAIHGLPIGQPPSLDHALDFYPAHRRPEIAALLDRGATHAEPFEFEADFFTADGRTRRVRSMGEPQLVDGCPVALIGVFQDVTERHAREETLRRSADTDALTGLPNRAWFEAELERSLARLHGTGEPAYLLLLDLDGFKGVNDTFGHAAGDDVLRTMATRLRSFSRASNAAARLGGDEFVVLVTRPRDCAVIEDVIADILGSLVHHVERDGERRSVSATVGAAFLDPRIGAKEELMRRADLALYEAKRTRRGTGRIFGANVVLRPGGEDRAAA